MLGSEFKEELYNLSKAVEQGDTEAVREIATFLLQKDLPSKQILTDGLLPGINQVRDKFEKLEVFLPDIIFASEAVRAGIDILKASAKGKEQEEFNKGRVVIGTVEGDIHDVGKTLVSTLLSGFGFDVYDLGIDVPSETFIERARELSADIIALSCLMTTTLGRQKEVIEDLIRLGLRDRFKVLVGGGAVLEKWAKEIGADGYGSDASEAVDIALRVASKKSN